jgi:broad specificity phosphatase PhoE/ribosomal protein S18 acetylase RimI-like enzyme
MSSSEKQNSNEGTVRPSIHLRLIRHAESKNNQVYRDARFLFRGGTPDFDEEGWLQYVNQHRSCDPGLSDVGLQQRDCLANYLVPHLTNQASQPVQFIVSPMRRTLETIRPTLERLKQQEGCQTHVTVHALYHESEGCHSSGQAQEGMSPSEIRQLYQDAEDGLDFEAFPDPDRGWYVNGKGAETRVESEARAAKFYLWLCEHLDQQLASTQDDIFDAGVQVPEEVSEQEHDKFGPRFRKRRTCLLVGHGDFMSLCLKRIVAGFGHAVETEGIPHRSAFVHSNTGMTELEYFGKGRFLIMSTNQTPHFSTQEYATLRGGDSLKDGWSYLMPSDEFLLDSEVSIAYADEEIEDYVKEQAQALKSLYLGQTESEQGDPGLAVEEQSQGKGKVTFFVKRGLQVVGCATYNEETGVISELALRPSARHELGESLILAIRLHAKQNLKRAGSLLVSTTIAENRAFLEQLGFEEVDQQDDRLQIDL